MPLMKLACTALERVPLTRQKIIEYLVKKFSQDLVFCRAPEDDDLTSVVHGTASNVVSNEFLVSSVESAFYFFRCPDVLKYDNLLLPILLAGELSSCQVLRHTLLPIISFLV